MRLLSAILFCSFLFLSTFNSFGQPPANSAIAGLLNVAPPSPEASALAKFVDVPVSHYTGVPNISVPLYNIKSGSIELPLSLSYHAGGVKVEDVASWAGLGWNLNAGGAVIRSLRGIPDEGPQGFITTGIRIDSFNNKTQQQKDYFFYEVKNSMTDPQNDIFSFNANGLNGKYFFKKDGSIVTVPQTKIKISTGVFYGQSGWKIINTNGEQYYFLEKEESASPVWTVGVGPGLANYAISSWYLSKIVSADEKDSIILEYDNLAYNHISTAVQTKYFQINQETSCVKQDEYSYSKNYVNGKFLRKIIFRNGVVVVNRRSTQREDLNNGRALQSIVVKNSDSTLIKQVTFFHSFVAAGSGSAEIADPTIQKRMYLDSLSIDDHKYRFTYLNSNLLPNRVSYNQDYWGFYNGAYNTTLLPCYALSASGNPINYFFGADRNPNPLYTTAGTLSAITYPTGGKALFEYENNSVSNFAAVADNGYDLRDSAKFYQMIGDPNGINKYASGSFTIANSFGSSGGVLASLKVNLPSNTTPPQPFNPNDPYVKLKYPNGDSVFLNHDVRLFLPVGTYQVQVYFPLNVDPQVISNFYFQAYYDTGVRNSPAKLKNVLFGGLRIKKISHYDPTSGNYSNKTYQYTDESDSLKSSGKASSFASFIGDYGECNLQDEQQPLKNYGDCYYKTFSTVSLSPLIQRQGSYVNYDRVSELLGNHGENGKNDFYFLSFTDQGNFLADPFPPPTSLDWLQGILYKETNFKKSGNGFQKVKEKLYNFNINSGAFGGSDSFKIATNGIKFGVYYVNTCNNVGSTFEQYRAAIFETKTSWLKLLSDTTRIYDQLVPAAFVQTVNEYDYTTSNLLTKSVKSYLSSGDAVQKNTKYSADYSISGTPTDQRLLAIKRLQDKGMTGVPVEESNYLIKANQVYLTSSKFTSYKSAIPKPDSVFLLTSTTPVSNFSPSTVSSGVLTTDSRYKPEVVFSRYNTSGNLSEQYKVNDHKSAILYNYQQAYPVCLVKNADSTSIAYTSFEAESNGNWSGINAANITSATPGFTGRRQYDQTSFSLFKSGLTSTAFYYVTYWSKSSSPYTIVGTQAGWPKQLGTATRGSNTWYLHEHLVTGQPTVTLSGSGTIDEVRLYPEKAQMTTYTYDPLVGITSQCDANNRVSYYEYDSFGRLFLVRDQDGKILKKVCYNYAGQAENCLVSTAASWQNTATAVRCKKNSSNQNTGEQEQEQVDVNSYSTTYNQTRWVVVATNTTACPLPTATIYARLSHENYYSIFNSEYADVVVRFYSDAACTIPLSVSNLPVNYSKYVYGPGGSFANSYSVTATGTSYVLEYEALLTDLSTDPVTSQDFYLTTGNYTIVL